MKLRSMDFHLLHILIAEGKIMPDTKKSQLNGKRDDVKYAHNPRYCMILPDADEADEENIISTGQS